MNTWKQEQPKAPGFLTICWGAFVLALGSKLQSAHAELPSVLGEYTLIRTIKKSDHSDSMAIGVFTRDDKRYIAKYWQGRVKNLNYYLLVHEFLVTKILHRSYSTHPEFDASVPEAVECFSTSDSFVAFFEYIDGVSVSTLSASEQLRLWAQAQGTLESIGGELTSEDRAVIGNRGPVTYFVFSVLFSLLLLLRRPLDVFLVGRTFARLMVLAKEALPRTLVLAHRDLTSGNLLFGSDGRVYILDFESLAYTLPGYDKAYLIVDPESKELAVSQHSTNATSFLEYYILLHHILGSGAFLSVNESYLTILRERMNSKV